MNTPRTDDIARGNHRVPTEWAAELESEVNDLRKFRDRYNFIKDNWVTSRGGTHVLDWRMFGSGTFEEELDLRIDRQEREDLIQEKLESEARYES